MNRSHMFRTTLYIVLLCMFVPVLVVGTTSTVLTRRSSEDSFHKERTQQLVMLKNTCDLLLDESNFIYLQLLEDEHAVRAIDYDNLTLPIPYAQLQSVQSFQHNLQLIAGSRPFLHSIIVYRENPYGIVISSRGGLVRLHSDPDKGWYELYAMNPDKLQYAQSRAIPREGAMLTVCISLKNNARNRVGVMVFNYNLSSVESLLPDDGTDWMVLDGDGELLFASTRTALTDALREEILAMQPGTSISPPNMQDTVMYQINSETYGWRYVNIVPGAMLSETSREINQIIVIVVALSLVAGILIAVLLSRIAARPIKRILEMIRHIDEDGDLPAGTHVPDDKSDEYEIISFNLLKSHLDQQRLNKELTERKLRLREAEMLALQAQINPHFLYNTMEIINWRAIGALGDTNEISRMITTLSELLRYALERPEELVLFEREVEHSRRYAELMTYRLGSIFSILWDIAPGVYETPVPKLILQPLIENAIQHGIQQMEGDGVIIVEAKSEDGYICLTVSDNGVGIPEDLLATLRAQLESFDGLRYAHIGLLNVYQRIRLITKDRAHMTIDSAEGRGTQVRLVFQIIVGGDVDENHT